MKSMIFSIDAAVFYNRGSAKAILQDYEGAMKDFNRVIKDGTKID